jgi:hypothetical protein
VHCTVQALHWTHEASEIARANARLIAAAPDLLEALKQANGMINEMIVGDGESDKDFPEFAQFVERTGKLIARAEGRK